MKGGLAQAEVPRRRLAPRRGLGAAFCSGRRGGTGNEYLCVEPQRPCEGSRMNMWDVMKAFKPLTVPREALRLEVIFFPLKLITILRVGELELMEMFKPLGVEFRHLSFALV